MNKIAVFIVVTMFALVHSTCWAQTYPDRTVRIVVPLSTGSATDTLSRLIAQRLNERWGKPVVVENLPGANGIIATEAVVKSPPDGYTLIMIAANHVINASLYSKLPFDTLRDVKPIVRVAYTPLVLCVPPTMPARSVEEFVQLGKAQPGRIHFGSAGNGSATHLAGEMFKMMANVDITHVPYKAISQAQSDLIGGQIESMFVVLSAAIPQVKSGKLRALGVTSLQRMPQLPDVPTIDEAGVKGYELLSWIGLATAAGTPDDIVNKIYADVAQMTTQQEFRAQINAAGLEPAVMAPGDFAAFMVKDQARWAEVVKASGAHLD